MCAAKLSVDGEARYETPPLSHTHTPHPKPLSKCELL